MLHSTVTAALAREHRQRLLDDAARHHLGRQVRGPVLPRTRARVGRLLIRTGVWLASPGQHRPEEIRPLALQP
jgi:hypothetical protein